MGPVAFPAQKFEVILKIKKEVEALKLPTMARVY
jgi:hypothetical protein